ncbi:hotdog domain-containing protein [Solidesulfovibrio magneticus]|uniref:Thioesterase superfamily domain protein n=1 Tax=Solidesulfovibrio magneticus (strain ATCC 700980 / DSM 13731 / RS-1) TaxID=573370 RepID=C4XIW4_SOLM1|nr:hotdog domain-containing protein [Solidesulfovibrio magneticus]BAH74128.1 thioesterase superfamily domain protein [Solidesulfovibrio magneticus RS-1]
MDVNTHKSVDPGLCGQPETLGEGLARVAFTALPAMAADDRGLVHGGFVFGLADYAAMLAVNDPNVVLGAAEVRFTAPVVVGETLMAEARLTDTAGKKRLVTVTVRRGEDAVFTGTFTCFVPEKHVLDR